MKESILKLSCDGVINFMRDENGELDIQVGDDHVILEHEDIIELIKFLIQEFVY